MLSRCPISGMHQPTRPFLRFSPSSLLPFVPPSLPPLSLGSRGGREGGGDPTRQCQVLVLTCPCENGAPITATEWTDFFRAKFTCVPRKRETLLLRDMMGSAGRCQIRGCYVRLAALSKRRRRQLRLPTRARAAPRSPVTSQPPGPSPTPPALPPTSPPHTFPKAPSTVPPSLDTLSQRHPSTERALSPGTSCPG